MHNHVIEQAARALLHDRIEKMFNEYSIEFNVPEAVQDEYGSGLFSIAVAAKVRDMLDPNLYERLIDVYFSEKPEFSPDAMEVQFGSEPELRTI